MHRLLCGLTFLSIWAVLLLSFPPLQGAEEYSFVRMWPNLPQPWYFQAPGGVAVDTSGNVYVADSYNDRIQVFRRSFGMRRISGPLQAPLVEWDSETANTYTLWLSPDLLQWIALPGSIAASDTGVNSWTDDGQHDLGPPSAATQRLYRIERLP
jgi:DNA-binding beta-propeller fold protein YncE